jgi:hypothetical protein
MGIMETTYKRLYEMIVANAAFGSFADVHQGGLSAAVTPGGEGQQSANTSFINLLANGKLIL